MNSQLKGRKKNKIYFTIEIIIIIYSKKLNEFIKITVQYFRQTRCLNCALFY